MSKLHLRIKPHSEARYCGSQRPGTAARTLDEFLATPVAGRCARCDAAHAAQTFSPRIGRPPRDEAGAGVLIAFRVPEAAKARYVAHAEASGKDLSTFIRGLLDAACPETD